LILLSSGWDCEVIGVQEDEERAGGRKRVKRTETVLTGRERDRCQIRASWRILEDSSDSWVVSCEEWSIGCGMDSVCASAIVPEDGVAGRRVGVDKK